MLSTLIMAAALATAMPEAGDNASDPFSRANLEKFMVNYFEVRVAADHCLRAIKGMPEGSRPICESYRAKAASHIKEAQAISNWCLSALKSLQAQGGSPFDPQADFVNRCTAMHGLAGLDKFDAIQAELADGR